MKLDFALAEIRRTGEAVLGTADIMALLDIKKDHASHLMSRLSDSGHLKRLKRGVWLTLDHYDPFALAEYLTAPFPAYISLQSALYHHGMISQIPARVYCVSPARSRVYNTPAGNFSIHHINEPLFGNYDEIGKNYIKIASPEKALFDFFYFSNSKTKLFTALPEVELPKSFSRRKLNKTAAEIRAPQRRSMVTRKIESFFGRREET